MPLNCKVTDAQRAFLGEKWMFEWRHGCMITVRWWRIILKPTAMKIIEEDLDLTTVSTLFISAEVKNPFLQFAFPVSEQKNTTDDSWKRNTGESFQTSGA